MKLPRPLKQLVILDQHPLGLWGPGVRAGLIMAVMIGSMGASLQRVSLQQPLCCHSAPCCLLVAGAPGVHLESAALHRWVLHAERLAVHCPAQCATALQPAGGQHTTQERACMALWRDETTSAGGYAAFEWVLLSHTA